MSSLFHPFKWYREWRSRLETVSWIVIDKMCLDLNINLNEMWNKAKLEANK